MISDVYFPRVNGVSTSIETFRRDLPKSGIAPILTAPGYAGEPSSDEIIRLPARPVPRDPEDRLMSFSAAVAQEAKLRAAGVALIHVQTPFVAHYAGLRLARRMGLPVVATYHTLFEEYLHHYLPLVPAGALRGLARRFSRTQCNAIDHVIVPSEAMRERLAAYGVARPMTVLPTGIPCAQFASGDGARFRAAHGIAPDRPVALFVGRVAFEKNIGFLLEALAHARAAQPEVLLLIAGEGPARKSLAQQAEAAGLGSNVRFLDYLKRDTELPDCYAAADLFVFASRTETQGLVLLEAMAAGTPVLALSAMGTASILSPQRGAVIAPDEPAGFGALLGQLLADPPRLGALAEAARECAAEWSDSAMAARLADLYLSLTRMRHAA
jgi:glycosyltransferase involved in cell wall biosynthesis